MTSQELEEKKQLTFDDTNFEDLVDIRDVKINTNKPVLERVTDFIEQIKNPYLFKVGDVAVKVNFDNNSSTFQEKFENFLKDCVKN